MWWLAVAFADPCAGGTFHVTGALQQAALDEVSGVAVSRKHPGVMWVHNDSGGRPAVYAVGPEGQDLGRTMLTGVKAVDYEDITLVPGDSQDWLVIGDIGDNRHVREQVELYRIPEPKPGAESAPVETMVVRYPDGAHNAETLLTGPDGRLFIVSKVKQGPSTVYDLGPFKAGSVEAKPVGQVEPPDAMVRFTGGDADGTQVVMRTYTKVHVYSGALPEALQTKPCSIDWANEQQGEAIGITPEGLVTISEGESAPIIRWKR